MRQLTKDVLEVIEKHQLWLSRKRGGVCANLVGADLYSVVLSGVNLTGANLTGATIEEYK